jgi:hypothetical protein
MGNIKFEDSPLYALPIAQNVTARAEGAVVEMTLEVITLGKERGGSHAAIRFAGCWVWYRAEPVLTIDHDPVMVGVHA